MVAKSTIFKTNRSQAVRLPKEVAFPEGVKAVQISVVGNSRIITPAGWKPATLVGVHPCRCIVDAVCIS